VLEQRVGLLVGLDAYVSVAGGVRITEPVRPRDAPRRIGADRPRAAERPLLSVRSASQSCDRSRRRPPRQRGALPGFDQLVVPESAPTLASRTSAPTLATALDLVGLGLGAESVGAPW
jgi:hypothetical protein